MLTVPHLRTFRQLPVTAFPNRKPSPIDLTSAEYTFIHRSGGRVVGVAKLLSKRFVNPHSREEPGRLRAPWRGVLPACIISRAPAKGTRPRLLHPFPGSSAISPGS